MRNRPAPPISAVIAAYNAEALIGPTIESILSQTRPPDEIVVVDDGSTDGTAQVLARYRGDVRVTRQANRGYPAAMNRAIRESVGEYVALCGADDLWEPSKLEWQAEALRRRPVEIAFGHARFFGSIVGDHPRPTGSGILDPRVLSRDLFRICVVNTPTAVIRRDLFDRVGWFRSDCLADDYEFYFNALRAGARFWYDPRPLVRYRRHERNITNAGHELRRAWTAVRLANLDLVADRALISEVLGPELFRIGRDHADRDESALARRAFAQSLRYGRGNLAAANVRALAWLCILSLPCGDRTALMAKLVAAARAYDAVTGGRSAALP